MEDVATAKLDARLGTELTDPADSAESVFVDTFKDCVWTSLDSILSCLLSCFFSAISIQAWKTVLLTTESSAWMSAWEHLVTVVLN